MFTQPRVRQRPSVRLTVPIAGAVLGAVAVQAVVNALPGQSASRATSAAPPAQASGVTNCQPGTAPTDGLAYMSDLSAFGDGTVAADDFISSGDTISQVTVWGAYLDPTGPGVAGPTGQEQYNCAGMVTDHFRVRVFTDAGGSPGTMVGESRVAGSNIVSLLESTTDTPTFFSRYGIPFTRHTLTLDTAVTGLTPGQTYWLEVANATFDPVPNDCHWHWAQHLPTGRDAYCVTGISPGAASTDILSSASIYVVNSERGGVDLAFCLESPSGTLDFQAPPAPVGTCWTCGDDVTPPTCTFETLRACTNLGRGWDRMQATCQFPPFMGFADCCCGFGGINGCVTDPPPQLCHGELFASSGLFRALNTCMTNDGPLGVSGETGETFGMDHDLWYSYRATCTGTLVVDTCAMQTAFTQDGFMGWNVGVALYHDFENPFDLLCPGVTAGVSPFQVGFGADENCNGITDVIAILDKFAGQLAAPPKFRMDLEPGQLNGKITVSDLIGVLNAFGGLPYPFAPPAPPCP